VQVRSGAEGESFLLFLFRELVDGLDVLLGHHVVLGESVVDIVDHLALNLDLSQRALRHTRPRLLLRGLNLVDRD